jgi:Co/Zn/Cd efflux system component
MFILISIFAVLLTFWLHYKHNQKGENPQNKNKKKAFIRILKDALATFGLTFWAALVVIALSESKEFPISTNINRVTFKNSLDFLLKMSALFLLFPFLFNLIKMCGELLLRRSLGAVLINFAYSVMLEFGIFWAMVILAFHLF